MSRIDEIKERLHAYKHWKEKAGESVEETHAPDMDYLLAKIERYEAALKLSAVRLEILTGRLKACNEETGKHELIDEAESFCIEAREALKED